MSNYIDFAELKARLTIVDVALELGLELKLLNDQLRGACPVCDPDGDRVLVITPDKEVFFCHTAKKGGDLISLAAHIKGVGMKEAAQFIAGKFPVEQPPMEEGSAAEKPNPITKKGWQGLTYLEHEHELVQELGFDVETSGKLGIGYAKKGMMRGRIAIPIRLPDGTLVGYIGVTDAKLPSNWQM